MKFGEMTLDELNAAVGEKSKQLYDIAQEAGPTLDFARVLSLHGDTPHKVEEFRSLNNELDELGKARDEKRELQAIADKARGFHNDPMGGMIHPRGDAESRKVEQSSIGQLFAATPEFGQYKSLRNWPMPAKLDMDIRNAVFRTGAGWDPETIRIPRFELDPQRPIAVIDNIPMLPTNQDAIAYMEETTFTNNAVETAESTATTGSNLIGEAALALTERTKPVEWLPVFIPVTMQQMEDVEGIEAYVDSRLRYMLRARLDSQILNGDGSTPNLEGTLNVSGINTQAKGSDSTPDAVYKGMTAVRATGFAEPSVVFAHPNDWQGIRLLQTADGVYLWGSPADAGPERIWGVRVVQTTAVVENSIITGDYANFSALYTKRGITLAVSDSHSHYFTRGMLAIRADMRIAMVHFRPEAFTNVTGV